MALSAREAVDLFAGRVAPGVYPNTDAGCDDAVRVLDNLVEIVTRCETGEVGAWRSALGGALAGEAWPPLRVAWDEACRTTTVPCGFASCEVHYGRTPAPG